MAILTCNKKADEDHEASLIDPNYKTVVFLDITTGVITREKSFVEAEAKTLTSSLLCRTEALRLKQHTK